LYVRAPPPTAANGRTDNEPACNFYEQLGGERQLDDRGEFGGMYGWADLRKLKEELSRLTSP
jgi:hypothetical protein